MKDEHKPVIAVLGGTGKEGSALAQRWARAGYTVVIGSRDAERAVSRAAELSEQAGGVPMQGMGNADATRTADIVVLSVPYSAHKATLEGVKAALAGKILVDVTVPLQPPKVRTVHLPEGQAAALEAQAYVGDSVRVVSAFQNVSYIKLVDLDTDVGCDILVCGDDAEAKAAVIGLVEAGNMRGIDAGPLANAVAVESLTPVLLYINKAYGIKSSGIHITGIS